MYKHFIEGMKILSKYARGDEYLNAEHDIIYTGIPHNPRLISESDVKKLNKMGFDYDNEYEVWIYYC